MITSLVLTAPSVQAFAGARRTQAALRIDPVRVLSTRAAAYVLTPDLCKHTLISANNQFKNSLQ